MPLTDDAIERLAQDDVSRRYDGNFVAERLFRLDNPDGIYFRVAAPPAERHGRRALDKGVLGDAGLFVHRADGTIRHFDPRDVSSALREPPGSPADRNLVSAVRDAMRRMG